MGLRNVPTTIKDANLAGYLRELRAAIGGVSDQVTRLVQTQSSSSGGGGGGTDPGPVDPGTPGPVGDGYPPAAPLSLEAIPAAFSVTLVWANPVIPDLQATEVWAKRSFDSWNASYEYLANAKVLVGGKVYRSRKAQDVNASTNVVTLNKNFPPATSPAWWEETTLAPTERSKVGESAGLSWVHDGLSPGETWHYWVRNRDIENLFSTYYPADEIGVGTTTLLDPRAYLDLLTNSITATQLYRDLGQRINLIDGPDSLVGSVNQRTTAVYNQLDGVIDNIVDGTTDITVKTDTGYSTLRALKTSTESSNAAIVQINKVDATTTSANAQALFGLRAKVEDPTTGLVAAQGYIAQLNTIDVTSTSANVQALIGLRGEVRDPNTGLSKAVANINELNNLSTTSTSANARKLATLDATVNTGPSSLSGQIAALNDVSVTSTSANAKALAQVQASNGTKISVFFQTAAPSTANRVTGDLWYDTDDSNKQYRWNGSAWEVYRDSAKTYSQSTAPTNTASNPLFVGDLWIDTTPETVNGVAQPKNIQYRWNGSAWQDVSKGLTKAEQTALITNLENTKIGYATRNNTGETFDGGGTITDKGDVDAWNAANPTNQLTWHIGLPVATAVKQVSVSVPGVCYIDGVKSGHTTQAACEAAKGAWTPAGTTAIEQQFQAQQEVNGRLYSQYTIRLDTNGWVSGFGLANAQQSDGSVISDFGVRADRFWIAPPSTPLTAQGGPGTKLVNLGSGAVIRVETIYGELGGVNGTYTIAYVQVDNLNGQSLKTLTGLDNYNPFTTSVNPNARRWVSMRNIRASLSGDPLNAWNQAFVPIAVGNFVWRDWRFGNVLTYASSLPGVTDPSRVVVLGVSPNLPTGSWGYSITTTDTTNDPAKIVADSLLPFIVTTTPQKYNNVDIPAGVYINNAYIASAMLGKAVMTGVIGSDNFVAGASGWQIDYNGNAEFNDAVWRGSLASTVVGSPTYDSAGNITSFGTDGWAITKKGDAVFNRVIVRSGANVGVNALSWSRYFSKVYNWVSGTPTLRNYWDGMPSGSLASSNKTPRLNANSSFYLTFWTPDITIPVTASRTSVVVCTLTMEVPFIARPTGTTGFNIGLGAADGVWLVLCGYNAVTNVFQELYQREVFFADGRDIQSRMFSGQAAFVLPDAKLPPWPEVSTDNTQSDQVVYAYQSPLSSWKNFHVRAYFRHSSGSTTNTYNNIRLNIHAYVE